MISATRAKRHGSILICVLVCLGIATSITLVSVRSSLQVRRQMRHELQLEQTRWLLEAGVSRAVAKLRDEPDYRGETWQVAEALSKFPNATVEIAVNSDGAPADSIRLSVTASIRGDDTLSKPTQRSALLIVQHLQTSTEIQ